MRGVGLADAGGVIALQGTGGGPEHRRRVAAPASARSSLRPQLKGASGPADPDDEMQFRTQTCAALGLALAGVAVSFEIAITEFWVPLSFGIIAIVFAVGAIGAAAEEAESQVLPALTLLIAAFAVIQGLGAMNDLRDTRAGLEDLQNQIEQLAPGLQQLEPGIGQ